MVPLLLLQLVAGAQLPEYHVRLLSDQQGLNTADILDLAKDKQGFLWLLSQSSVQRYDGRQASPFLFNETIRKIFVDKKDRKWVLSNSAVYLFKNDYEGFKQIKIHKDPAAGNIQLFDSKDGLYLVMTNGFLLLDETKQVFMPATTSFRFSGRMLPGIFGKADPFIFLASSDSIYRFDLANKRQSAFPFKSIAYLLALNSNELLVSDWNSRSFHISFPDKTIKEIVPAQIRNAPQNDFTRFFGAVQLQEDRFFLSSNTGVVEFDRRTHQFHQPVMYNRGRLLNDNPSIKTFYKDDEGNVFMTHADGLAFFNSLSPGINFIRDYTSGPGTIPDIDIRCFAEDKNGNTWLGTVNGIARLNMQTG
ncbi:MAG: hypothetical protein H7Y01_09680, partial [Ferruginibacter sp.]|nr:hypothetical protein [Chitinophagaceae bacterium]